MTGSKTLKTGSSEWLIVDDGIKPAMPCVITEARLVADNVIYLSLAQGIIDGENPREAHICARLRIDLNFAQVLHAQLDRLISRALKPSPRGKQAN